MVNEKIIPEEELSRFGPVGTVSERVVTLVTHQKSNWELAGRNYLGLALTEIKSFDLGHFKIIAQHNPERLKSSAAKTDAKSIYERPCFLCIENLPPEQKGILINDQYIVLVNPYPIFPVHLTISKIDHTPQLIKDHFSDLLKISRELEELTIFYNGPECGASAPDHFHFQAVFSGILPVENEFEILRKYYSDILAFSERIRVYAVQDYIRRFIALESDAEEELLIHFYLLYNLMHCKKSSPEPMMNILCNFMEGKWRVIIFPREKQRPVQFFESGTNQVVFSPASVELGGLAVFPIKEDFDKITQEMIADMYEQVTLHREKFMNLVINYTSSERSNKKSKTFK